MDSARQAMRNASLLISCIPKRGVLEDMLQRRVTVNQMRSSPVSCNERPRIIKKKVDVGNIEEKGNEEVKEGNCLRRSQHFI